MSQKVAQVGNINGFKGSPKKEGIKDPQQDGRSGEDIGVLREILPHWR